ncbi:hypothetical protein CASFOL_010093 [Castilleja foliolosa]|uniref:Uncharacterized protein n=1 Tax=Castilleja foliolosa TaxID=1961234 RepID=A0ABD3DS51_9LAMI
MTSSNRVILATFYLLAVFIFYLERWPVSITVAANPVAHAKWIKTVLSGAFMPIGMQYPYAWVEHH